MKTAKILSLGLLTIGLAAIGCGSNGGGDSDSGTGGKGNGSDSGTGGKGSGTDSGASGGHAGADGGDGSGSTGSGSGGKGSGTGGQGSGTGGSNLPSDIEFDYDPSKDMEPETCADVQIDSEEVFLDIFMQLDRSGSMTQPFGDNDSDGYCDIGDPNNGSRWCNAINAIYGFFSDPTTVGTGLSYGEFRGSGSTCSAVDMDLPFGIIESGDTNGHLAELVDRLNDNNPNDGTPTLRAINTLIEATSEHNSTGTRRTIAILITDGNPQSCNITDVDDLAELLNDHFDETGIPTYIIGMDGASVNNLETLAVGSGAEPHTDYCDGSHSTCSYYTVGNGDPEAFIAALDSIRGSVLGCEYVVPASQVGLSDLDTLDVQFTPESTASAIGLTRVASEVACADDDEYFVDTSGVDPIVKLCPATCDLRGEGASVDISLKCEGS